MAKDNIPLSIGTLPQPPVRKAEDYLKAYSGYPYTAVSSIADAVASIKLHLFKRKFTRKGVETDEIFEHPALSLLYYANTQMTYYDLLEATQVYLDLVGEAFWVILRDGKNPVELWPVRPDWMTIKPSPTNVVDGYIYRPGGVSAGGVEFKPENVIHFKYFNPLNPYRGKGSVQAAAGSIDIHNFATEWNRNFFFNSATPGMVFTTEQKVSKEAIDRFMASWQQKFGGRGNSNKVAFLGGGFKVDKVSQTAKEMDFTELQRVMRDDILAVFKVPKTVLGLSEDVNRANAEATTLAFMERVVTPRMQKLVAHLNEFYLPAFEDADSIFFDFDDPAPQDTEQNLKIYESGLSLGWLTRNEVRESENLPPVDGGDVLYIPFSYQPIGQDDSKPDNKPNDNNNQDENNQDSGGKSIWEKLFAPKQKGEIIKVIELNVRKPKNYKKERKFMVPIPPAKLQDLAQKKLKGEIKTDLIKLIGNMMAQKPTTKVKANKKGTWSEEKRQQHWEKMVAKTDVYERKYKDLLVPLMQEQEKEVLINVESAKNYARGRMKGKESSFLFNIDREVSKFVGVIIPFEREIVIDKGAEALDFLGTGGALDTFTQSAIEFVRKDGTRAMTEINKTTRDELKRSLAEGITKGEDIDTLKSRVSRVYQAATGPRSELIARTEVLKATNFATNEAYRQSGIVEKKEWLTAVDERVCPWCDNMDGKIIGTDDNFFDKGDSLTVDDKTLDFSFDDIEFPPLHPQCRCTLIPVL